MKTVVTIIRFFVGLVFIFSGLVKANDPLGLSYKMQEFFEVWGVHGFHDSTLTLSILMNAFEIIAGVALLLGWQKKMVVWLLLLLIIAFTILTGYTYFTGKPKNCGCFGDCLPISSQFSFYKDVLLTGLIVFLVWQKNKISPLFSIKWNAMLMLLVTLFSFALQWYALRYLPVVDCLPYKKGKNITAEMQMPANAIPDSMAIDFVYERNGKRIEFNADNFPTDFDDTYVFKERIDKIVRKGKNNKPPIEGFSLSGITGADSTEAILQLPYTVLIFSDNLANAASGWEKQVEKIIAASKAKNSSVYLVTGNADMAAAILNKSGFSSITVFSCDFTALRTAARANPTVYLLKEGTIVNKQAIHRTDKITRIIDTITLPMRHNEVKTTDNLLQTDSL